MFNTVNVSTPSSKGRRHSQREFWPAGETEEKDILKTRAGIMEPALLRGIHTGSGWQSQSDPKKKLHMDELHMNCHRRQIVLDEAPLHTPPPLALISAQEIYSDPLPLR